MHELAGPPGAPTLNLVHRWGGTAAGNWSTAMSTLATTSASSPPTCVVTTAAPSTTSSGWPTHSAWNASSPSGTRSAAPSPHNSPRRYPDRVEGMVLCAAAGVSAPPAGTHGEAEIPTAIVVTRQDRLIPAWRQLQLAQSLPGATVHSVEGNHFAFARYALFVPVLLEACHSVARRVHSQQTTL